MNLAGFNRCSHETGLTMGTRRFTLVDEEDEEGSELSSEGCE